MPLFLGLAALHLFWLVFDWGGEAQRVLLGNVLFLAPWPAATLVALCAALEHRGRARRGWLFVALGIFVRLVSSGLWSYFEVVAKTDPFPSAAGFFYLMYGPLWAIGVFHLIPAPYDRLEGSRLALDMAITVGVVSLFFWYFLLAPPLTWGMNLMETGLTLAYPLLSLLLLALLLLIVMRRRHGEPLRLDLLLMAAGIGGQVSGNIWYNVAVANETYQIGHPVDGVWMISAGLVVCAAYVSRWWQRDAKAKVGYSAGLHGYLEVALPHLAVASGLGLLLVIETNSVIDDSIGARGVLYGIAAVTLLVIARQLLAFSENRRLTQYLEHRVRERTAELEALSNKYRYGALHDALTGLSNRTHFQLRLDETVAHEQPFAVLYLDFDRFKAVNDSFGHAVGDDLLRTIAKRLEGCVRPGDLVARLGGDEFAVLLVEPVSTAEAEGVAERLTQAFQMPIQIDTHTLYCSTSIGMVISEVGRNSAENVLRDADIAMYRAKAAGRSRFVVFEVTMRENIQARLALEADLRWAVEREELEVYYQPVMHGATGKVAGFEALVRWHHLERGLISPSEFIPLAEETGLVIDIDRWVLRTACAQLKVWSTHNPELGLGVNLSSRQFSRPDLAPFIAAVLAEFELAPHRLKLELTEGLLMDTSLVVHETLAALRLLGLRLHIDDFGTGYSSLSYLQRFDATALKVDRSFVMRMLESEDSAELVRTVISMAHNLGMQVIAEGVETEEQYARLRALGCEYMQGDLFSKPVPATAAEVLLQKEHATVVAQPEPIP